MCLAAAAVLLLWGAARVVPGEGPDAPPRRSPSGFALLGAVLLLGSAMLRIERETAMMPWFLVLPAYSWILRAAARDNRITRVAFLLLIAAECAGLVLLFRQPVPSAAAEAKREIVAAARASLAALEHGRGSDLRDSVEALLRDSRNTPVTASRFRAAAERTASLPPLPQAAPPGGDAAFGSRFVDVTLSQLRYWFSIFTLAGGAAVVLLAPFFIIAGMPRRHSLRLLAVLAVLLAGVGTAAYASRRPSAGSLRGALETLDATLRLPDGSLRAEHAFRAFLGEKENTPAMLAARLKTVLELKTPPPPIPRGKPAAEELPASK